MKKISIGWFIIASALLWAVVLIGCSLILYDTTYKNPVNLLVGGGWLLHLIIIWIPLANKIKKAGKNR